MSAPSVDNAAARFAGFLVALSSPEEQRLAIQIMFRDLHDAGVSRPTIVAFGDAHRVHHHHLRRPDGYLQ